MTYLLIDGDIYAYKITAADEQAVEWEEDQWSITGDAKACLAAFDNMMSSLCLAFDTSPEKIMVAFSDKENFRKGIYPKYKANRKGNRKPVTYSALVGHISAKYKSITYPKLEADDVLGIIATTPKLQSNCVILSSDKDFKQIPGKRCNPFTGEDFVLEESTPEEAEHFFFTQVVTGDATDGYPGCPGIGEKTVEKLFTLGLTKQEYWRIICDLYKSKGLTEEDALVQAHCAKILRYENFNSKSKEIILWQKPTLPSVEMVQPKPKQNPPSKKSRNKKKPYQKPTISKMVQVPLQVPKKRGRKPKAKPLPPAFLDHLGV